jgi:ribonuclease Z
MNFTIQILGSSAALPTSQRNPSAQVLEYEGRLFLIDCAEGTQMQMRKFSIAFRKVSHVFISHLHGDHYFGLVGLLFSFHLLGRTEELHVYAKKELEEIINLQLSASDTHLSYPLLFHPVNPEEKEIILDDENLTVEIIPLKHSIPCCGFLFREKAKPRKIDKHFLVKEIIPISAFARIKAGEDYLNPEGILYKNCDITIAPSTPYSFAYCADTLYNEQIVPQIAGVDVLYHEATFMNDKQSSAKDKFHSTAQQAAEIAKKAGAGTLVLGHFSARYDDLQPLLEEAKAIFENTVLAEEGLKIAIG